MSELILSAHVHDHLAECFSVAANAHPTEAGAKIEGWLAGKLGPLWDKIKAAIKAAVESGAVTPQAIMAYLASVGIVLPPWVSIILPIVLPLILNLITA